MLLINIIIYWSLFDSVSSILYYVDMKYKSCDLLEHGLLFDVDNIAVCCLSPHRNLYATRLINNYHGESIDWDKLFSLKQKIKDAQKTGKVFPVCEGCYNLNEKEWSSENFVKDIYISHWAHCNCDCSYCYFKYDKRINKDFVPYKIMPILIDMKEKNILREGGNIIFSGGEATILDEFDDILNFFYPIDLKIISVNSSGIKYNETLAKGIEMGKAELTVSIDSSDRDLYKKVKQIDAFDKVIANIKRYAEKQVKSDKLVRLKYIIIPGVNDSIEEIEKWLQLSESIGIKYVIIDLETKWYMVNRENIPENIYEIIKYVQSRTKELNVDLSYYSHALQLLNDMK